MAKRESERKAQDKVHLSEMCQIISYVTRAIEIQGPLSKSYI